MSVMMNVSQTRNVVPCLLDHFLNVFQIYQLNLALLIIIDVALAFLLVAQDIADL